jgi:hypothetical protein
MPSKASSTVEFDHFDSNELGFKLPLPILVEGEDRFGNSFKEKTVLSYISHQGSSFWLANAVSLGHELKLTVNLPPKLAEEKNLKLMIKGTVVFVEASTDQNSRHRVSLKFENKYMIKSDD